MDGVNGVNGEDNHLELEHPTVGGDGEEGEEGKDGGQGDDGEPEDEEEEEERSNGFSCDMVVLIPN